MTCSPSPPPLARHRAVPPGPGAAPYPLNYLATAARPRTAGAAALCAAAAGAVEAAERRERPPLDPAAAPLLVGLDLSGQRLVDNRVRGVDLFQSHNKLLEIWNP